MFSDLARSRDISDHENLDLFKVTDPTGSLVALASLPSADNLEAATSSSNRVVKTHRVFTP
jgi:hypothetical protein